MRSDVERALRRVETGDHFETGLVCGTFGLLGVLKRYTDLDGCSATPPPPTEGTPQYLVPKLRALIFLQELLGLGEVVLNQVKESSVIFLRYTRVVQQEGAEGDQCIRGLTFDQTS